MANLGFDFDAQSVDPAQTFDPLPAGEYVAAIVESEMRTTRAGDGQYLFLVLEILDGNHQGRKVFDRLNLDNPNKKAEGIAMATLSAISHAVGVLNVNDSEQLHNRPMVIKVSVRPASANYPASNEVKGYKAAGNKKAPAAAPAASAGKPDRPVWAQ